MQVGILHKENEFRDRKFVQNFIKKELTKGAVYVIMVGSARPGPKRAAAQKKSFSFLISIISHILALVNRQNTQRLREKFVYFVY
jgi:hypothetical protein